MRKSLSDEFGVFFRLILVCVCVLFLFSHVTEMLSHLSIVLLHVIHIELLCFRCLVLPFVFVCVYNFFILKSFAISYCMYPHTAHLPQIVRHNVSFAFTFHVSVCPLLLSLLWFSFLHLVFYALLTIKFYTCFCTDKTTIMCTDTIIGFEQSCSWFKSYRVVWWWWWCVRCIFMHWTDTNIKLNSEHSDRTLR